MQCLKIIGAMCTPSACGMRYGVIMITLTLNLRYTVGVVKHPPYAASAKPLISYHIISLLFKCTMCQGTLGPHCPMQHCDTNVIVNKIKRINALRCRFSHILSRAHQLLLICLYTFQASVTAQKSNLATNSRPSAR